jgi:hypothetical protein
MLLKTLLADLRRKRFHFKLRLLNQRLVYVFHRSSFIPNFIKYDICNHINEYEMGIIRSMHGEKKKFVEYFGRKTGKKETTLKS